MVLADEDSPVCIPHASDVPASMWFDEPKSLDAFRTVRVSPGASMTGGDHAAQRLFTATATAPAWCPSSFRARWVVE